MKLRFAATFDPNEYRKRGILQRDCLVIMKHAAEDRERIQKELYKIVAKNDEAISRGKDLIELDVIIDIAYRKRSADANRLMWALYTIIADALNREQGTRNRITPEELYEQDMVDWAPRHRFVCEEPSLEFFKIVLQEEKGKIKKIETEKGICSIEVWQTSSFWNTKQMAEHIDRLLNTLEQMGIIRENSGDLDRIMKDVEDWRKRAAS
jgi:hypothetical protein